MKRFIFLLTTIFICTIARADNVNINWIVGDNTYSTTQCEMGNDLILPTTPTKTGYTFRGWRIAKFTPIEYLESTGYQLIDTGIVATINTKFELKIASSKLNANPIFGDNWYYRNAFLMFENNFIKWHLDNSQGLMSTDTPIQVNTPIYIKVSNGALQVNNDYYIGVPLYNYNINKTVKLFFHDSNPSIIKMYYFQIYDNDVLVRDFIPVIDNDGVPCMYDKVEGKLYYNAGTGQFIAGPIINE